MVTQAQELRESLWSRLRGRAISPSGVFKSAGSPSDEDRSHMGQAHETNGPFQVAQTSKTQDLSGFLSAQIQTPSKRSAFLPTPADFAKDGPLSNAIAGDHRPAFREVPCRASALMKPMGGGGLLPSFLGTKQTPDLGGSPRLEVFALWFSNKTTKQGVASKIDTHVQTGPFLDDIPFPVLGRRPFPKFERPREKAKGRSIFNSKPETFDSNLQWVHGQGQCKVPGS